MISLADIFEQKRKRYGVQEASDFVDSYRLACQRVVADLESPKVGLSDLDPSDEDIENAELDIDEWYRGVIMDGIDVYLAMEGRWGMATNAELTARYEQGLNRAHTRRGNEIGYTSRVTGE